MNIAQNPAQNVSQLYTIAAATAAFLPDLGTAPNAWTVAIQYTGGGLNEPTAIAADQSGNIWVVNSASGANSVSMFNNAGTAAVTSPFNAGGDIRAPAGLAIDLGGHAWIANSGNNTITELSSSGALIGTPLSSGLNQPTGIAIDGSGNLWVVNTGSGANSVAAFTSAGATVSGSPFTRGGITSPSGIAINGNANANCADCQ